MKKCGTCKNDLPLDDFAKNKTRKDGRNRICRACQKEYKDKHYLNNKSLYLARNKSRRKSLKEWFTKYRLSLACVECGENHPATLDFHHLDKTTKKRNVATMVWNLNSISSVLKEIGKCVVMCSNCHRKLHWKETHKG